MQNAKIENFLNSPLRSTLTSSANDGTSDNPGHPKSNDAGNWTGCERNKGNLVGTYRDISACMLSDYLGRPATKADLKALSEQDAKDLIKIYFWDKLQSDRLTDQDVANISNHVFMHYGNVRVVQKSLNRLGDNLTEDGIPGPLTNAALRAKTAENPDKTYNTIREELRKAYASNSVVEYREPFLRQLDLYFPVKETVGAEAAKEYTPKEKRNLSFKIAVLIIALLLISYYFYKKKKS